MVNGPDDMSLDAPSTGKRPEPRPLLGVGDEATQRRRLVTIGRPCPSDGERMTWRPATLDYRCPRCGQAFTRAELQTLRRRR
jgi:predicted RNA-binding Zn-ribbon protein involved in translation (DUF1610 family)